VPNPRSGILCPPGWRINDCVAIFVNSCLKCELGMRCEGKRRDENDENLAYQMFIVIYLIAPLECWTFCDRGRTHSTTLSLSNLQNKKQTHPNGRTETRLYWRSSLLFSKRALGGVFLFGLFALSCVGYARKTQYFLIHRYLLHVWV
jgi:hypothetical protein